MLRSFRKELTHLEISSPFTVRNYAFIHYPKVRFVRFEEEFIDHTIVALTDAYPKLRELEWIPQEESVDANVKFAEKTRARNRRQFDSSNQDPDAMGEWESLDRLHANLIRTYAMGLRCHIAFWEGVFLQTQKHVPLLRAVLEDIRPTSLSLRVNLNAVDIKQLSKALRSPSTTHFRIVLRFGPGLKVKPSKFLKFLVRRMP